MKYLALDITCEECCELFDLEEGVNVALLMTSIF
jgi:hypothetical protein